MLFCLFAMTKLAQRGGFRPLAKALTCATNTQWLQSSFKSVIIYSKLNFSLFFVRREGIIVVVGVQHVFKSNLTCCCCCCCCSSRRRRSQRNSIRVLYIFISKGTNIFDVVCFNAKMKLDASRWDERTNAEVYHTRVSA